MCSGCVGRVGGTCSGKSCFRFIFGRGGTARQVVVGIAGRSDSLGLSRTLLSLRVRTPLAKGCRVPAFGICLQGHVANAPLLGGSGVIVCCRQSRQSRMCGGIISTTGLYGIRSRGFSSVVDKFCRLIVSSSSGACPINVTMRGGPGVSFARSYTGAVLRRLAKMVVSLRQRSTSTRRGIGCGVAGASLGTRALFSAIGNGYYGPFGGEWCARWNFGVLGVGAFVSCFVWALVSGAGLL